MSFSDNLTYVIEFVLNEDVGDFLKHLKGPIGVVAVAGLYRTGKSYLLNRMLLNRSGGFGVGPTVNPCTKVSRVLYNNFKYLLSAIHTNHIFLTIGLMDLGQATLRFFSRR
jgi:hypothetical protein